MTDRELISKRLAEIEVFVRQLRELGRPEEIEDDVKEERFIVHTLQLAVQNALDVASHIVSDDRLGEPRTYRELFDLLCRHGWIGEELKESLRQMAGFRNLLVHEYAELDLSLVRTIVENRLDDLLAFVRAIRAKAPKTPGRE